MKLSFDIRAFIQAGYKRHPRAMRSWLSPAEDASEEGRETRPLHLYSRSPTASLACALVKGPSHTARGVGHT